MTVKHVVALIVFFCSLLTAHAVAAASFLGYENDVERFAMRLVGHALSILAAMYLYVHVRGKLELRGRGWNYIKAAVALAVLWNGQAMLNLYIELRGRSEPLFGLTESQFMVFADVVSFDHLTGLPIMLLFFLGLLTFLRTAKQ